MLDVEAVGRDYFPFVKVVQTQGLALIFGRGGGLAEWQNVAHVGFSVDGVARTFSS